MLWFQPPYSPDCNPIERFWAGVKAKLAWQLFEDLEQLQLATARILNQVSNDFIASISGRRSLVWDLDYLGDTTLYRG